MNSNLNTPGSPRWLHALAVLTVLCTLPLLFLGAGVTSHGVGMVDPRGFRPPWEIVNGLIENSGLAWRLEYGHRTFGFLVGLCGIGLAVGCWFFDPRPWMGWVGVLALALICVQGALGIFRVDYNALHGRTFALIHGVFAQLVFAMLVSVALLTSRRWANDSAEEASPALRLWSLVTALLVFGQLLFGGMVRHHDSLLGPRGHLCGAFVVVAAVVWLLKLIRESQARERFAAARILFMALLGLQLMLGMESWLAKYYARTEVSHEAIMPVPMHAEWVRTAHYLVGSLIFATSVSVALLAQRRPALTVDAAPERVRELEGAL
jgi:cytochrome c oxidase assembly protein subunit 15